MSFSSQESARSQALLAAQKQSLELSVLRRGDQAVVRVRDTGRGIRAEHMERIFEPLFGAGRFRESAAS